MESLTTLMGTVKGKHTRGVYKTEDRSCVKRRQYTEDGKSMLDCEFADGERYLGSFKDGLYHGHGTYIWNDGSKYIGEFKDGLTHGHGTYIYASGEKYIGEFKDAIYWNGVYYNTDGTVKGTYWYGEWIRK